MSLTPNIDVDPVRLIRSRKRRQEIRDSLAEWMRHCGYEPAAHHLLRIRELEALERGEFDRLAVAAGQDHGFFPSIRKLVLGSKSRPSGPQWKSHAGIRSTQNRQARSRSNGAKCAHIGRRAR